MRHTTILRLLGACALCLLVASALALLPTAPSAGAANAPAPRHEALKAARGIVGASAERGGFEAAPPSDAQRREGAQAWQTVYATLMSPRCMNCHPAGDRPLQKDISVPHAMNISRQSEANGLACATCHQTKNADDLGNPGGPPGAPNWHLPEPDMPLIFEGRSAAELCAQLKRPRDNGHKSLAELLHHVSHDPLVLWGWRPGGGRTLPPSSHPDFVAAFTTWTRSGGACP